MRPSRYLPADERSYAQSIASIRAITGQGKGPIISLHHGFLGCASDEHSLT